MLSQVMGNLIFIYLKKYNEHFLSSSCAPSIVLNAGDMGEKADSGATFPTNLDKSRLRASPIMRTSTHAGLGAKL